MPTEVIWTMDCRLAESNNGIQRVHLNAGHPTAQSTELFLNAPVHLWQQGDVWEVHMKLKRRRIGNGQH